MGVIHGMEENPTFATILYRIVLTARIAIPVPLDTSESLQSALPVYVVSDDSTELCAVAIDPDAVSASGIAHSGSMLASPSGTRLTPE